MASFHGERVHLKFLASCRIMLSTQVKAIQLKNVAAWFADHLDVESNPPSFPWKNPKFQSPYGHSTTGTPQLVVRVVFLKD